MGFAIVETPDDIKLGAQDPTKVTYPVAPTAKPDTTTNDTALQAAYADLYAKQAALSAVVNKLTVAKSKDITAEAEWKTANDAVNKSRADLSQAIAGNDDVHKEHDKWVVTSMQDSKFY
jgi:organic hydroperoxide reductase OsmC/OhrA